MYNGHNDWVKQHVAFQICLRWEFEEWKNWQEKDTNPFERTTLSIYREALSAKQNPEEQQTSGIVEEKALLLNDTTIMKNTTITIYAKYDYKPLRKADAWESQYHLWV